MHMDMKQNFANRHRNKRILSDKVIRELNRKQVETIGMIKQGQREDQEIKINQCHNKCMGLEICDADCKHLSLVYIFIHAPFNKLVEVKNWTIMTTVVSHYINNNNNKKSYFVDVLS